MASALTRVVAATLVALAIVVGQAAALAAPAAARTVTIGIGDQRGTFFDNARFRALGIRHARLLVPWDAHEYQWQTEGVDRWLEAAHRTGVQPLIVFDRSITEQYHGTLPSVEDFAETVTAFRARYPWVREFATWNEPNLVTQPTYAHPDRVADFYELLRARCDGCRVLGASILGLPGMAKWVRRFLAATRPDPRSWGLHNYLDVNTYNRASTRSLLKIVKGDVWLTETAGLVAWRIDRLIPFPMSPRHAAFAMEWLFDWVLPATPRVKRVYLYQWDPAPGAAWDSALVDSRGRSRPALKVVRRALKHGIRRTRSGEKKARSKWVRQHGGR